MEGERVKHLRAKFQGNRQKFPKTSNRPGIPLADLLAKEEIHGLKPGPERDQSTKLPKAKRMGLKNAPFSQDDVPGLGLLCEDPAWVANSKDRNAMESSLHPAGLQTGIQEALPEQKGTKRNSNLPQRSQTQQTWPLIRHARNQGVNAGAPLVPAKGTAVPSLLDTPRSVSEKWQPKVPKRKPLPHATALGLKPMKPQRPPEVDLERFWKAAASRAHAYPAPEPVRGMRHGHRKPNSAASSPDRLSSQAAPSARVPSSAGEELRCDQEQIYDDVEALGPIGKGKGCLLSPASRLPASPRSGTGAKLTPDRFPPPPAECRKSQISELSGKHVKNLKQCKKEEQADKEFQKKFKFEGEIRALTRMMVDPNVAEKKGGGKNLPLRRGEILDVIQLTSPERILCRNNQWKYGYVPRVVLLQLDTDIYDDVAFCDEINSSTNTSK
ncbi:PML-RARA-regulated adapter molecule 1 [Gopherus flavomarginatus]|uniref:PML-RARA-regulated adapter molecule 1 n=1 Tax=Gopherus flavomarginatus TaxID=286002 RepID=UPI0021CBEDB8|nr:PML-RARA-regulated adapter molecule 1 [Gopherus flavomarginatus]